MKAMQRKRDRNQGRVYVMRNAMNGSFYVKAHKHRGRVTVPVVGPSVQGSPDQDGDRKAIESAMDAFRSSYRDL